MGKRRDKRYLRMSPYQVKRKMWQAQQKIRRNKQLLRHYYLLKQYYKSRRHWLSIYNENKYVTLPMIIGGIIMLSIAVGLILMALYGVERSISR